MAAPSVTLKSLKNTETGIDITVPGIHEEEAPLGGVSILFQISVVTNLNIYKSSLAKDEDVVHFPIFKAYREIEDLRLKFSKKFPKASIPQIPHSSSIDKLSSDEKVAALNNLMAAISKDKELGQSSIFSHFVGIPDRKFQAVASHTSSKDNSEKIVPETVKESDESPNHLFPKVTSTTVKVESTVSEKAEGTKQVDLFDEVKTSQETATNDSKRTTAGLFDDFEDDDLFSSKSTPKPFKSAENKKSSTSNVEKTPTVMPKKNLQETKTNPEVDDSQIIIKDRKLGEVSLFDEQDLGEYITKEEEPLFLVTPEEKKMKKNDLLLSTDSEPNVTAEDLHENLDDLLNLNPLPMPVPRTGVKSSGVSNASPVFEEKPVGNVNEMLVQPKKPVPLPRKKSLGRSDSDELGMKKPEVLPRKVFLKKPEVPAKPSSTNQDNPTSTKPPVSAKPVTLPKPKPPIKGPKPTLSKDIKNLDEINANKPAETSKTENKVSSLADELNRLDLLKYIEQEQKISEAEPSLFD